MQALELNTVINEQHQIHLQLPDSIKAGKAKVIVLLDETAETLVHQKRIFGQFRGKIKINEDFDNELPEEFWLGKDA